MYGNFSTDVNFSTDEVQISDFRSLSDKMFEYTVWTIRNYVVS